MTRVYLLAWSETCGTRAQMIALLNRLPTVTTWRTDLPHAFYLVSNDDASTLTATLKAQLGARARFLVTEIGPNRNGWLTRQSWYLINNKRLKPVR